MTAIQQTVARPAYPSPARRSRVLPERAGVGHDRRGIGHRRHDHRPGPGAPEEPAARMSTVSPRRVAPAPLAGAVRTVNRWGLLAGVTGFYGNVLLLVLFTTPADGPWSWTGPASDTTGIVSPLAMIPVAAALRTVCGGRRGLGAISSLAIVAMAGMAAVSMLFVLGGVSFAMSVDSSYVGLAFMFGWVFAAGLAGRTSAGCPVRSPTAAQRWVRPGWPDQCCCLLCRRRCRPTR